MRDRAGCGIVTAKVTCARGRVRTPSRGGGRVSRKGGSAAPPLDPCRCHRQRGSDRTRSALIRPHSAFGLRQSRAWSRGGEGAAAVCLPPFFAIAFASPLAWAIRSDAGVGAVVLGSWFALRMGTAADSLCDRERLVSRAWCESRPLAVPSHRRRGWRAARMDTWTVAVETESQLGSAMAG